jgi:hypothetical protein
VPYHALRVDVPWINLDDTSERFKRGSKLTGFSQSGPLSQIVLYRGS